MELNRKVLNCLISHLEYIRVYEVLLAAVKENEHVYKKFTTVLEAENKDRVVIC